MAAPYFPYIPSARTHFFSLSISSSTGVYHRCHSPLVALACFGFAAGGLKSEPVISAASAEQQQRPHARARTRAHEKPGGGGGRGEEGGEEGWRGGGDRLLANERGERVPGEHGGP